MFSEYLEYDAIGLADLIRRREVSAEEILEAAIHRIEAINPALNAVVHNMYNRAREQIQSLDPSLPLSGVPFLLKDLNQAYIGVFMQNGSRAYRDYIPDYDSTIVSRYRQAGLVCLGKTNTPEFGLKSFTEPKATGITRNPWHLDHTPGGSSGGSGAAVAAGMVPVASGSDAGGSIRIPASHCHLFGLKPSRGRMPFGPHTGESRMGATSIHVLSHSVRDSALLLDLTKGHHRGARAAAPQQDDKYLVSMDVPPERLRIGFLYSSPFGQIHPSCENVVKTTAQMLEEMGHQVEEVDWPVDAYEIGRTFGIMYFGEMAATVKSLPEILGRKIGRSELELSTRILAALGKNVSAGDFVQSIRTWERMALRLGEFFDQYDVLLTPTVAHPPIRIGALELKGLKRNLALMLEFLGLEELMQISGMVDKLVRQNMKFTPFTQLANVTGVPAMSVPSAWTDEGLPLGAQFVARYGDEKLLFKLARQIEQARPWRKIAAVF